jgi:hypothetical protein
LQIRELPQHGCDCDNLVVIRPKLSPVPPNHPAKTKEQDQKHQGALGTNSTKQSSYWLTIPIGKDLIELWQMKIEVKNVMEREKVIGDFDQGARVQVQMAGG